MYCCRYRYGKRFYLIIKKLNQIQKEDQGKVVVDTNEDRWVPGHGGLRVYPLHSFGTAGTALVKWPKGKKFKKHSHLGGEEIFVLSGEFKDEHGSYPAGTWIRSPHLSVHDPFVEKETVILVKTGHLT